MEAPLLPDQLRGCLKTRLFGAEIRHFDSLDSTQQAALEAAAAGAAEGTLFLAECQTSGRGRHGHSWESPAGEGLYASLVLRPRLPPAAILPLTLAAGLAVADAVVETCGLRPDIRWPNDLLIGGKKFCGLLIEASLESGQVQHAVLGVGINVRQRRFPPALQALATSLDLEAGRPVSRLLLCAAVLHRLEERYLAFDAERPEALLREFEARSGYARGLAVEVGGDAGYRGQTEGLDASGFLRVRLPDGSLRLVVSGDVRRA